MDPLKLLLECHGSEVISDWSRKFEEGSMKRGNGWFGFKILQNTNMAIRGNSDFCLAVLFKLLYMISHHMNIK